MKKFLKHTKISKVWHYPNFEKSHKYPTWVGMSMCGILYNINKQSASWPLCKRCIALERHVDLVDSKLPEAIHEQSFEPPEAY